MTEEQVRKIARHESRVGTIGFFGSAVAVGLGIALLFIQIVAAKTITELQSKVEALSRK